MIRNFLFHRVTPQRDELWDPMDVLLFDRCINYITKNYRVVQLEELVNSKREKKEDYATITFDDGYKDNIEYAAPILDKYKCKASFYVVTDCIEKNIPTWTHVLEHYFQNAEVQTLGLTDPFFPKELQARLLKTKEERITYVRKLIPFLKRLSHPERKIVLDKMMDIFSKVELPKIMMHWEDIKQLSSAGHYIGSHSASHCMFGTMTDEQEIKNELLRSGQKIKEHVGYFPKTIAYPLGSYDQTTIKLSKACGYSIGLAVKQKIYNPQRDNDFEIPRIELYNESWWKTRLRITTILEDIKKAIGYK